MITNKHVYVKFQIADKDNKGLAPVIQMFSEVEEYNTSTKINQSFPLVSLLPPPEDMERYYTYWGSLTTPPCSEAVTWILFPNPLPISGVQVFMCDFAITCLFDSDRPGRAS